MATFRVQVFYQRGEGEKWTNVYHADSTTLALVANSVVNVLIPGLLPLLHSSCRITKFLVSSLSDDTFIETPVEEAGTSAFTDSILPFFNCVKAFFTTDALGRPDYKFYKGWLTEALNDSQVITPSDASDFKDALDAIIEAMDADEVPLVSESGDPWLVASVQPAIQMRQMHRRRRPATP